MEPGEKMEVTKLLNRQVPFQMPVDKELKATETANKVRNTQVDRDARMPTLKELLDHELPKNMPRDQFDAIVAGVERVVKEEQEKYRGESA